MFSVPSYYQHQTLCLKRPGSEGQAFHGTGHKTDLYNMLRKQGQRKIANEGCRGPRNGAREASRRSAKGYGQLRTSLVDFPKWAVAAICFRIHDQKCALLNSFDRMLAVM